MTSAEANKSSDPTSASENETTSKGDIELPALGIADAAPYLQTPAEPSAGAGSFAQSSTEPAPSDPAHTREGDNRVEERLTSVEGRLQRMESLKMRPPDFPGSAWQVRAKTRIEELREQLLSLAAENAQNATDISRLRKRLSRAESVLRGGGLAGWLRGGNVEYAWQTIHAVERAIVPLLSMEDLVGRIPGYIAAAVKYLPKDDKALAVFDGWKAEEITAEKTLKARVQTLMQAYNGASDEFHESARRLRNRMLGISLSAIAAEILLILVQWRSNDLWLIPAPSDASKVAPWALLFFVMLAGTLGAFVSAIPSMVRSSSGGIPYKLPTQQALLKLAIGPLVAIVGIMLVLGGLADVAVQTVSSLLGVAIVFGAGQQVVSGFADRKANELLKAVDKV